MEIAFLPVSTNLIQQASNPVIGMAVLSKSLEIAEQSGQGLINMMEKSVTPNLGNNIDIRI